MTDNPSYAEERTALIDKVFVKDSSQVLPLESISQLKGAAYQLALFLPLNSTSHLAFLSSLTSSMIILVTQEYTTSL